ncbi:ATP-binding protein [Paenibacillus sp. MMS18-CY102]|uniref:ATP-binding protein n=1 Tax=Paenibacillus sp. MMS18-CY102 TaxID=2682849 RepID=UPI001365DA92|nr:ATP-binding protein [Paenibacillus sp. MMS18-CY102]MWC27791.1 PAS domain S-box protein [Paenibacillus sp. MMS18-CY102]
MNEYIDTNMRTELLVFLVLAFVIIVFSSFTMFTLITHLKRELSRRRHVWLLGGSAVYGIGLWSMHFLALLSTNHYSFINVPMLLSLFVSSGLAYLSFLMLGSERMGAFSARLGLAALLLGTGSALLHYLNRMFGPVEAFHFDPVMFGLSIAIILLGSAIALLLHEMNPESTVWPASIVLGSSCMMMHMLGMRGLSIEYSEVMTAERLNEYYMVLAIMLGLATLTILGISLMTRMSDRRYRQADQRYKQLVENSIDMIAVLDGNHWEYINRSGLRLFHASERDEMVGKSIYLFLHPKHHADTAHRIGTFEPGKTFPPEELEWFTVSGKKLYTEVVIASTTLRGRPAFQLIVRDISERKKNEELLINSEKLYVAGQLAAGIAHEIRNPLTSLKGFLQLISTGRSNGRNYFDIMKSELNRIESIVSELLMLSKPQVYELAYLDMRQVLDDTVMLLEAQASLHNTEVAVETDSAPLWVFGVENQIKQAFINVIKNAIEAMEDGGMIAISSKLEDGNVVTRIIDQGPGIPKEQLAKMGQPFYTTKDRGTGLGLMVTFKIVDNHQGRIQAHSEMGEGATFVISFPYATPPLTGEQAGQAPGTVVASGKGTVLRTLNGSLDETNLRECRKP